MDPTILQYVLILLQAFQVAHLWLHDWLPLGRLNQPAEVLRQSTPPKLVLTTLIQSVPFTIGLVGTIHSLGHPFPGWLTNWLWISYAILFAGELLAWWKPYLFGGDPLRIERYRAMFGRTHTILPQRHGFAPNTLHLILHLATAGTLLTLFALHTVSPR